MVSSNKARYYDFGHYRLDITNDRLLKNNETIPLTQKSVDILRFLVQNSGEIINKTSFFNTVWAESYVDETNLTQHIYRLRKALEDTENGNVYIETIPKCGYRFIANVVEVYDESTDIEPVKTLETPTLNTNLDISNKDENKLDNESNSVSDGKRPTSPLPILNEPTATIQQPPSIFNRRNFFILFIGAFISLLFFQAYFYITNNVISAEPRVKSVVVLPFKLIGDAKDERLGLGTADAIISQIGKLENFKVNPTESIINYSKNDSSQYDEDLFKLGNGINADILITGTLQQDGNSTRINVMFYHVENKRQICTAKLDGEFSNVFALQDSVSNQVLKKLLAEIEGHMPQSK